MSRESTTKPFFNSTVPIDWDIKTVGEAFEICNSLRLPISAEERGKMIGQYPYYGPTKIQGYLNEYRINGTYALIGEDGDHFLKWKELPMTLLVRGEFNVNNHAHIIRGNENITEWFFYYFNHRELTPHLTRQGAGRYKLTKDSLSKILIPVPPLAEQRAIATCLSIWDKAIEKTTRLIAAKEQRKKWLMRQLLTGKKRLKGFGSHWKEYKICQLGQIVTGNTPSMSNAEFYGDKYCWATAFDFKGVYIDNTKTKLSEKGKNIARIVPQGSILVTCIASIGKNAIANVEMAFNQQINAIVPNENFHSEFIYYSIENSLHKLKEVAGAGAVAIINKANFETIKLRFPSLEEQTAIANILQTADKEINLLKQKLAAYKEQKKGLMQVLLTGKVRLKVKQ
jgi:type I restriction enzyme S subunit